VVLGGEDVARRPGNLSTEGSECLDEDCGLDGHVKTPCNTRALKRLVVVVLLTGQHQTWSLVSVTFNEQSFCLFRTWHLDLGELNLATTESGQADIRDLVFGGGGVSRHDV